MKIGTATVVGTLLLGASILLLWVADSPLDVAAIAGGIGVVIAGALIGLTVLAAHWRSGLASYTRTSMDEDSRAALYADIAAELAESAGERHGGAAEAV